ncbi:hypothetical protein A2897_03585 [Candidatus Woesebacteria bacterium RIFCSPLOWO2_01_FULL_44_24b]|nr:MAG: hypothetical protein A2897_03585 [Candidatus Woesebacteria bacterium RIFCSPLOWO2_01_FULL_44_24b]
MIILLLDLTFLFYSHITKKINKIAANHKPILAQSKFIFVFQDDFFGFINPVNSNGKPLQSIPGPLYPYPFLHLINRYKPYTTNKIAKIIIKIL